MASAHPLSARGTNSSLQLCDVPMTDVSIVSSKWVDYDAHRGWQEVHSGQQCPSFHHQTVGNRTVRHSSIQCLHQAPLMQGVFPRDRLPVINT